MNCMERFHAALTLSGVDRVPVTGITQTGTVDLMEACGAFWPEAHRDPKKMAKLAWAAYEIAGVESVRVPFDVYPEAEALGTKLFKWKKNAPPMVEKYLVEEPEDVDTLRTHANSFDPHRDGRIPIILEAVKLLVPKCLEKKLPIISPIIAPFSLVLTGITDMQKAALWLRRDPNLFIELENILMDVCIEFGKALVEAGVDTIFYNDTVAANVSLKDFEKFAMPYEVSGAKKFREFGAYVLMHTCGDCRHILSLQAKVGVHGLSIGQEIDMAEARKIAGDKAVLCGNVNPVTTLILKSPEDVMKEARYCIDAGVDVLAPGCGYSPKTSLANMKALVEAGKKYGWNARLARR